MISFFAEPSVFVALLEVACGVYLLSKAADEFVEGAANVASIAKISPVVVGAVIVGFGTSAPELLVSSIAAKNGNLDLGVGNIVGSNVANLTLVLGVAAFLVPILVTKAVLVREAPLSLFAVLAFGFVAQNGLTRNEGFVLLALLVAGLGWVISTAHAESVEETTVTGSATVSRQLVRTVVGLVGTVLGAQLLVWGATSIADSLGLSGGFVGFTLVAIGTSLPELVTAIAAAKAGQTELLLGNLLGSNIFNSLAVGGVIAVVGSGQITDDRLVSIGIWAMVLVAGIAWVFMVTRKRVHKLEACVLLGIWLTSIVLMAS